MNNSDLTFIIVEDTVQYQTEVLNQLGAAGFSPGNKLGVAATYDEAKDLLEQHASRLDLVFLDLNIPRNQFDPKPEDKHGMALLNLVHNDLVRRAGVDIRVIVVSGQDLAANEATKALLIDHYAPTLAGVVEKSAIVEMIKANLKRLRRDPVVAALRRLEIDLISEWTTLTDTAKPTLDRMSAGRTIAIRIAQNELDYREGREHSHPELEDNLGGIGGHLMTRFEENDQGRRQVSAGSIRSQGGWGCFVWRGVLMEHFRTINMYWNAYKHRGERPYDNPTNTPDEWRIPESLMDRANTGEVAVQIVELAVRDLLEWYLPWHEQTIRASSASQ